MAETNERSAPDPIDIQVGMMLRQLRRDRGISQTDLGSALGITFQQIQKYERGANRISASMLVKAASVMKVQPADLLPRTDAAPLSEGARAIAFAHGAREVAERYAAIKSPRRRRALLALLRAFDDEESSTADDKDDGAEEEERNPA